MPCLQNLWGDDVYFIGQASCAATVEDGREQAFQRAIHELLNFAQRESAKGLMIHTQMVFEKPEPAGCPEGTVTVWRLLRIDANQLQLGDRETAATSSSVISQQPSSDSVSKSK